ncbi:MAG: hypothetical protein HZA91_13300 [Verrucomicrobia bacterium]|nr:hypothetical protein [Verrucomicrobiota bacterium]
MIPKLALALVGAHLLLGAILMVIKATHGINDQDASFAVALLFHYLNFPSVWGLRSVAGADPGIIAVLLAGIVQWAALAAVVVGGYRAIAGRADADSKQRTARVSGGGDGLGGRGARNLLLALALLLATGCAGGGGTVHDPPDHIVAGQPATLELRFSVWGAGFGNLSSRYTKILCHYRKPGETQFQSVSARVISSDHKHMDVEFIIPPQQVSGDSSSLEYYFDFLFDGQPNTQQHKTVRIVRPAG